MDNNLSKKYNLLLDLVDEGNINAIRNLKVDKSYIDGLPIEEMRNFIVSPLKYAIEAKEYNTIKFLLDLGANKNMLSNWIYGYNTPIQHAVIKAMDSYNSYGTTTRETEIIELLLSYNCDTNILDGTYRTALDIAIEINHYEAIELIKAHGGKTFQEFNTDLYNKCARYKDLLNTCTYNSFNGVEINRKEKWLYLTENLNDENIDGISFHNTNYLNTPLNYAIDSFNYDVISYLLKEGANPSLECLWKYGTYTPFFVFIFASYHKNNYVDDEDIEKILNILLDSGVNINLPDSIFNETPLDVAMELEHHLVIDYIKNVGGKRSKELEDENKE